MAAAAQTSDTAGIGHRLIALVVGTLDEPVDAVVCHAPSSGELPSDTGFTILLADAPHADDLVDDDPRVSTVCLDCALDRWPELGRGLDLAREHGEANLDDDTGEWCWP